MRGNGVRMMFQVFHEGYTECSGTRVMMEREKSGNNIENEVNIEAL